MSTIFSLTFSSKLDRDKTIAAIVCTLLLIFNQPVYSGEKSTCHQNSTEESRLVNSSQEIYEVVNGDKHFHSMNHNGHSTHHLTNDSVPANDIVPTISQTGDCCDSLQCQCSATCSSVTLYCSKLVAWVFSSDSQTIAAQQASFSSGFASSPLRPPRLL